MKYLHKIRNLQYPLPQHKLTVPTSILYLITFTIFFYFYNINSFPTLRIYLYWLIPKATFTILQHISVSFTWEHTLQDISVSFTWEHTFGTRQEWVHYYRDRWGWVLKGRRFEHLSKSVHLLSLHPCPRHLILREKERRAWKKVFKE